MVYKCKDGGRLKIDPQVAGEEIERIRRSNAGIVTPKVVVQAAKNPRSPLHNQFEWDDTKAAVQYRLVQARELLRFIEVVENEGADDEFRTRAFVHIGDPDEYRSIGQVARAPDMMERLMAIALGELTAFKKKYTVLQQLAVVFEAIDAVEQKANKKRRRRAG